jgi:hypothetical protein
MPFVFHDDATKYRPILTLPSPNRSFAHPKLFKFPPHLLVLHPQLQSLQQPLQPLPRPPPMTTKTSLSAMISNTYCPVRLYSCACTCRTRKGRNLLVVFSLFSFIPHRLNYIPLGFNTSIYLALTGSQSPSPSRSLISFSLLTSSVFYLHIWLGRSGDGHY